MSIFVFAVLFNTFFECFELFLFCLLNFAAVLTVRILIKLVTQHLYVPKWLLTCMDTRGRWTVSRLHGNTHAVRGVLESYTYSAAMLLSFLTVLLLTACAPRTPYTPYRQQRQGIYDFWCGMEKNNSIIIRWKIDLKPLENIVQATMAFLFSQREGEKKQISWHTRTESIERKYSRTSRKRPRPLFSLF